MNCEKTDFFFFFFNEESNGLFTWPAPFAAPYRPGAHCERVREALRACGASVGRREARCGWGSRTGESIARAAAEGQTPARRSKGPVTSLAQSACSAALRPLPFTHSHSRSPSLTQQQAGLLQSSLGGRRGGQFER